MLSLLEKFFGTANERKVKDLTKAVTLINSKEAEYQKLKDAEFKSKTAEFKKQLEAGTTLEDILPDAFAACREAAKRTLNMRHFDVQLMGGMALHNNMIAEMGTGEGKTLVCTLAAYLNALTGKGVHVVTVNDYLAQRDSAWMGKVYEFLGLSVACIYSNISEEDRQAAYQADITYGTNNEFGFDYLRDNLKLSSKDLVQRAHHYAIVDEVDSILIDEARTPLIISGPAHDDSELCLKIVKIIPKLKAEHYDIDEKSKNALLTESGTDEVENLLKKAKMLDKDANLYDVENVDLVHHVNKALKAEHLFKNEVDYIVKDDQVMIIDEFTGRAMPGRRYSDGLHQALEAKEGVTIQRENQTLASTTFQNYFRNYEKLAGMTGTATTEAVEFSMIYNLDVISIPTNLTTNRKDHEDEIYKNLEQKYKAILKQIKECHEKKQPLLVGTVSIEKSELIAKMLKKEKIKHNVLNAKHHSQEAQIIAQAGRLGAVTIATNMAGRGTDIMLGGNPEMLAEHDKKLDLAAAEKLVNEEKQAVIAAGGLFVIGTERHESRRIDNQLRGRAGRQGDAGETKFFLSLEDDLMRIFGSDKISVFLEKLGFKDDESIYHPWITKALEKAQTKVEAHNFEIRKSLIKFDDVLNEQRKVIYEQRNEIMNAEAVSGTIADFRDEINLKLVKQHIPEKSYIENWDLESLDLDLHDIYGKFFNINDLVKSADIAEEQILEHINKKSEQIFAEKKAKYPAELLKLLEKNILLMTLDGLWRDHLNIIDHLKTGINLRAYGQKDPLNEFKREAFELFEAMLDNLVRTTVKRIARAEISDGSEDALKSNLRSKPQKTVEVKAAANTLNDKKTAKGTVVRRKDPSERDPNDPSSWGRVGRNEMCPCGSGKKYKNCHGKL